MKTLQKFSNIDIFNNSSIIYNRKSSSKIASWISILLISSLIFSLIIYFYEYDVSSIYYAKVVKNDDDNYLYFSVDQSFISMKNRNYLEINGDEYKCHLSSFSDNYYLIDNKKVWEVYFDCELPEEVNINDNLVEIRVEKRRTTLFKEIVNKLRKEFKDGGIKKWGFEESRWRLWN